MRRDDSVARPDEAGSVEDSSQRNGPPEPASTAVKSRPPLSALIIRALLIEFLVYVPISALVLTLVFFPLTYDITESLPLIGEGVALYILVRVAVSIAATVYHLLSGRGWVKVLLPPLTVIAVFAICFVWVPGRLLPLSSVYPVWPSYIPSTTLIQGLSS